MSVGFIGDLKETILQHSMTEFPFVLGDTSAQPYPIGLEHPK